MDLKTRDAANYDSLHLSFLCISLTCQTFIPLRVTTDEWKIQCALSLNEVKNLKH